MNEILLFTGNSGAGKSTIAHHIAKRFDGVHLSEREISRSLAFEKGYDRSRVWVKDVGLEAAASSIRERTLALIGEHENQLVLVDGVYDRLLPPEINRLYTARRLGIIAVEASSDLRVDRCARRMGGVALSAAQEDVAYLDAVKEHVGAREVVANADLRIINEGSIEEAVEEVARFYQADLDAGQIST